MNKRKQFGVSADLQRSLSEAVSIAENTNNTFRTNFIPISRIELDPENPRQINLGIKDLLNGIEKTDSLYDKKQYELAKLQELANTIKNNGIVNPIVVYKRSDIYRVVAGERRTLATILAGKKEIEARIYNEKPSDFSLKIVQWIENNAREDLTLQERLKNIEDIVRLFKTENSYENLTLSKLSEFTGLSDTQLSSYLCLLSAPQDVKKLVEDGMITNLDKATFLAKISDDQDRFKATQQILLGNNLKKVKQNINGIQQTIARINITRTQAGRVAKQINFGVTKNMKVAKYVIDNLISSSVIAKHRDTFFEINWQDFKSINAAIKQLLRVLELEIPE